jgi:hypothetical protein
MWSENARLAGFGEAEPNKNHSFQPQGILWCLRHIMCHTFKIVKLSNGVFGMIDDQMYGIITCLLPFS